MVYVAGVNAPCGGVPFCIAVQSLDRCLFGVSFDRLADITDVRSLSDRCRFTHADDGQTCPESEHGYPCARSDYSCHELATVARRFLEE
jgi:hypothetical protein